MKTAISDMRAGLSRVDLAVALAREDLRDRFRRSYIGLAWILLSFLVFVLVKSLIFNDFFDMPGYDFFSHLIIGFALFGFISGGITGGSNVYVANRTWVLSTNLPYTIYAHVLIIRALIELGLVGLAGTVLVLTMGEINPDHLLTLPFVLLPYYLSALGLCLALGPVGARYRDVVYAVQTSMRVLFFATPIIWVATPGTMRGMIAAWNPLTYYIDIVRAPIIEGRLPIDAWIVVLVITTILMAFGLIVFTRTKRTIPLWL